MRCFLLKQAELEQLDDTVRIGIDPMLRVRSCKKAPRCLGVGLNGQSNILENAFPGEQVVALKGSRNSAMSAGMQGGGRNIHAAKKDPSSCGWDLTRQDIEQRRLAGAVRSDESAALGALDRQADIIKCEKALKTAGHLLGHKEAHRGRSRLMEYVISPQIPPRANITTPINISAMIVAQRSV